MDSPSNLNLARVLTEMSKLGMSSEDPRTAIANAKRAFLAPKQVETSDIAEFAIALGKVGALADGIELLRSRLAANPKESDRYFLQNLGWELRDAELGLGDEDALLKLLEEAQALKDAEAVGPDGEAFCFNVRIEGACLQPLSGIAAAMTRAGRWTKAVAVARRLPLKLPRVEVLGVVAATLASMGQTRHALQVALETKKY